ncbi:hypothetical protein ACHAW5_003138 [Stephanodiscus triporus]|uniref:Uncharacterized protein n=1 Tax=Stephanodiscus triporus TaxID=2934178 RepID=A0ABD3NVL0_9STRA
MVDDEGTCSPRRSSESPSSSSSSAAPQNSLKTTGLQESDWYNCQEHEVSSEEDGVKAMMQYLPHSAALLVTALQRSGIKGKNSKKSGDDFYYHYESDDEEVAVAGIIRSGISQITTKQDGEITKSPPRPSLTLPITLTTPQMEINERVADMLLESIIQMDDNCGGCSFRGSTRKKTGNVAWTARREGLGVAEGSDDIAVANDSGDNDVTQITDDMATTGSGVAATTSYDNFDHNDDDSIGGDISLLVNSIARLQRDLENADLTHLDWDDIHNFYDDDDDAGGGAAFGDDTSLLSRLKRWVSRGMIMEQKLLHAYISDYMGNENYDDYGASDAAVATEANSMDANRGRGGGRYADHPVLIWSMALMWAFVVLKLMCPKMDGDGMFNDNDLPAQFAYIIDWMFG